MADRDRTVAVVIQKVNTVGYIVGNIHMIKNPIPARLVGPQSITVSALILAITMMRGQPRISFPAAGVFDGGILKSDRAAVGR